MNTSISQEFMQFSAANHPTGSGTAASYRTALDKLDRALMESEVFLAKGESVWDIRDVDRLTELYHWVKQEQKKTNGGIFRNEKSKSYWQKGFCSAAVKAFAGFLILGGRQKEMLQAYHSADDGVKLSKNLLGMKLPGKSILFDDDLDLNSLVGKTAVREKEERVNQAFFRDMILEIYDGKCCLTGLPIPEVLRASHISPWASDVPNRMNPANGLCLSATYDAAFDRHLISFDEDYRLIFSSSLKEYYTNDAFQKYFQSLEGQRLRLPRKFLPMQNLLEMHRKKMMI